jgi:uncharacterized protein
MSNSDEQAQLSAIHVSTEKATVRALRNNRNVHYAISFAAAAQAQVDTLRAELVRKGVAFDCRKGCAHCCSLRVEALPQESFRVARALRGRPDIDQLLLGLQQFASKVAGLRLEQHNVACPFLVDQQCSIYDIRPFACRQYNSLDVKKCEDPLATPPEDMEMVAKASAMLNGTVDGYARLNMASQPHEFIQGVHLALTDPTAEKRWFKGEPVFAPLPESGG